MIAAFFAGLRLSARRLAIVIGFALTTLSSLGPQFYVGPVEDGGAEADETGKTIVARIDGLRAAQSQYLLFQQIGAMIYALSATGISAPGAPQRDTLNDLYQLSLIDRSTSVTLMIGELAKANQLVYRQTADKYGALIAAARKDMSLAAYRTVDDFESGVMNEANALMARQQRAALDAARARSDFASAAARRKGQLLALLTLGSTLLLAANLMSERAPAQGPGADPAPSPAELEAAVRLIELAAAQKRAPNDSDRPGAARGGDPTTETTHADPPGAS